MNVKMDCHVPGVALDLDVVGDQREEGRAGQRGDEQQREAVLDGGVGVVLV
jgi:hypothetical protein